MHVKESTAQKYLQNFFMYNTACVKTVVDLSRKRSVFNHYFNAIVSRDP